jgi:hypothetical protein
MAFSSYLSAEPSIAAVQQAIREERRIGLLLQRAAEVADPAAVERITAGLETRSRRLNRKEREIVAFYEVGQAAAASDPVRPQQRAGGNAGVTSGARATDCREPRTQREPFLGSDPMLHQGLEHRWTLDNRGHLSSAVPGLRT